MVITWFLPYFFSTFTHCFWGSEHPNRGSPAFENVAKRLPGRQGRHDRLVGCYWRDTWLVVSNIFFPYNIWDVILPIDFHIFQRGLKPPTRIQYSMYRLRHRSFETKNLATSHKSWKSREKSEKNPVEHGFKNHGKSPGNLTTFRSLFLVL